MTNISSLLLDLTSNENRILHLIRCFSTQYSELKAGVKWIAHRMKISVRQVQRILKGLFEKGLVARIFRAGKQTIYRIVLEAMSPPKNPFRPQENFEQKHVHNPDLSSTYEPENVTPMSPPCHPPFQEAICINNGIFSLPKKEDANESDTEGEPDVDRLSSTKKEKRNLQATHAFRIIKHNLGGVAWYLDIPSLQLICALPEQDIVKVCEQFIWTQKQSKGFVQNPSGLITRLCGKIKTKKGMDIPKSTICAQKLSKREIETLQNLEIVEQHKLISEQFEDGYWISPCKTWRYHVLGSCIVFRNLQTDKVIEINALKNSFTETLNRHWDNMLLKR